MSACEFCDEFQGGNANAYALRYRTTLPNRVIFGSDTFRIMPSIGQIAPGHLLIVPVEHVCALADLPVDLHDVFGDLYRSAKFLLRSAYGRHVLFEHGIRQPGSGGCGIDHAHMHVIPVEADGVVEILRENHTGGEIEEFFDINTAIRRDSSYLYFEDSRERKFAFAVGHIQSQYIRKLIVQLLGKTNWDWRSCRFEPELVSVVERLSPLFMNLARG